jgi:AraC-like DNA-binding protein
MAPSTMLHSLVWFTPEHELTLHSFGYGSDNDDGLPHTHSEYCIVICLRGYMEIVRSGERQVIRAGELVVVNPGEVHRCRFGVQEPRSEGLTLIITRRMMHQWMQFMAWPECGLAGDFLFVGKYSHPEAASIATKLVGELQEKGRGYSLMMESLAREILVHVLRSWPGDLMVVAHLSLAPQLPWLHMHKATEYMNRDGKGAFRLSALCTKLGVSPSRFTPLFKNSGGVSPHMYYNSLLVYKARRLLQEENCATKEVALKLGFKSVSHFCALFHQITGVTPQSESPLRKMRLPGVPSGWD